MRMRTNSPAVDTRPKFLALPSFHRVTYVKNFGLGMRLGERRREGIGEMEGGRERGNGGR